MTRIGILVQRAGGLLLLMLLLHGVAGAQQLPEAPVPVAVLEIDVSYGVEQTITRPISDRLRQELFSTGAYRVVERGAMEAILAEQGLQLSGCVSDECAVEAGRLLGVERMIAGSFAKIGQTYTLTTRIIDVETGEVLAAHSLDCRCSIDEAATTRVREMARLLAAEAAGEGQLTQGEQGLAQPEDRSLDGDRARPQTEPKIPTLRGNSSAWRIALGFQGTGFDAPQLEDEVGGAVTRDASFNVNGIAIEAGRRFALGGRSSLVASLGLGVHGEVTETATGPLGDDFTTGYEATALWLGGDYRFRLWGGLELGAGIAVGITDISGWYEVNGVEVNSDVIDEVSGEPFPDPVEELIAELKLQLAAGYDFSDHWGVEMTARAGSRSTLTTMSVVYQL